MADRLEVLRDWPDQIAESVLCDSVMKSDFLVSYATTLREEVGHWLSNQKINF